MAPKILFVFFISHPLELDSRRSHLYALSNYADVLCVEPPASPFRLSRVKDDCSVGGLCQVGSRLYTFQPGVLFPYTLTLLCPALARLNVRLIRKSLHVVVQELKHDRVVVSIRHPAHWGVVNLVEHDLFYYELSDNWTALPGTNQFYSQLLRHMERRLLEQADVVAATSQAFLDYKDVSSERSFVLHNGAEVDRFIKSETLDLPADLQVIPPPRIGLIGHLTPFVDYQLLLDIAHQKANWSLVLIGGDHILGFWSREKRQMTELLRLSNVHYLGLKPYETLPAYTAGLDVCLMPYQINEYTKFVYPNKVHQYLAAGKAVVSTDMAPMRIFEDVISLARTRAEFITLVEAALLKLLTPGVVAKRRDVARHHSLDRRARRLLQMIREHLSLAEANR